MALYEVAGLSQKIELPVPLIQAILPAGQTLQRPGIKLTPPFWGVLHETANEAPGADAAMHARYLLNGAEGRQASWHFSVDDRRIYQHIPVDEVSWQAADGGGPGNMSGIAAEVCVNQDGNEALARRNAEALFGGIFKALGMSANRLQPHWYFNAGNSPANRHHCPDHMLNENYVPTFRANVAKIIEGGAVPTPAPQPAINYPDGMDKGLATLLFSSKTVGGVKYGFDEKGAISALWLARGKATGAWPSLVSVKQFADSPTQTRTFWTFADGWTVWRANDNAPVKELK